MRNSGLILIGAGGHCRSCIDVIEREGNFRIGGLAGLSQEVGTKIFGYEVLTTDAGVVELIKTFPYALIALGQIHSAELRIRLYQELTMKGFRFPTIIAPTASVSARATIGAGTIVMHGAVINAGAVIGENCIINSTALVEHDSRVADHCHVSTGAILNGGTSVGSGSFIGSGATLREGISVAENSMVGMGLVVQHDLPANSRFRERHTS